MIPNPTLVALVLALSSGLVLKSLASPIQTSITSNDEITKVICSKLYLVQTGDTCTTIYDAYSSVLPSLMSLYALNPGLGCEALQPQQQICIQGTFADTFSSCMNSYVTVDGDSCWSLAAAYTQLDLGKLVRMNSGLNCFPLLVGAKICIYGLFQGSGAVPVPSPTMIPVVSPSPVVNPSPVPIKSSTSTSPSSPSVAPLPSVTPSSPNASKCYISSINQVSSSPPSGIDVYSITVYASQSLVQGWWAELTLPTISKQAFISDISPDIVVVSGGGNVAGQMSNSYTIRTSDGFSIPAGGSVTFSVTVSYPPVAAGSASSGNGMSSFATKPSVALVCPSF